MEQITTMKKEDAQLELDGFTNNFQSITLATVSKEGVPFASYAPFVEDEKGRYYVCVSGNVPHSHNMNETKKVSIMFIEDEKEAAHPFGRKRLYFEAKAKKFDEHDKKEEKIQGLFEEKFGDKVSFMFKMPDFRIYKITPKEGSLVLGFGAAFRVSKDKKILKAKTKFHAKSHEENLKG